MTCCDILMQGAKCAEPFAMYIVSVPFSCVWASVANEAYDGQIGSMAPLRVDIWLRLFIRIFGRDRACVCVTMEYTPLFLHFVVTIVRRLREPR